MARQKTANSPFLYDDNTGDIVGFKDPDGSERYWVMHPYQPFEAKDVPTLSVVAPASTRSRTGSWKWSSATPTWT